MQWWTSSSWPAATFAGQSGSASRPRPSAMKSAWPFASASSASAAVRILPTAITGMPTACFTASAYGRSTPSGTAIGGTTLPSA